MESRKSCGLAIVALTTSAAKPIPPVLVHSGPWDVHSSENACMLARPFGTEDQQTLVAFQPLFNASTGELLVLTRDRGGGQRAGTATIAQDPSGRVEEASYFSNLLPREKKRVTRITVTRAVWEGLQNTDVLSITAPPVSVRVKLVRFNAAKAAFDKCETDTLKTWGVDPIALDPDHAPVPTKDPGRFFSPNDYPTAAISAGHIGRVVAILNVDKSGVVTDCRIGSSSWADLNDATCKQSRRVQFTPGRDSIGRPVAAIYLLPVRWAMPGF